MFDFVSSRIAENDKVLKNDEERDDDNDDDDGW